MAARWLRRVTIVALVVAAILSITTSAYGKPSGQPDAADEDQAWLVTDTGWALVAGNRPPIRDDAPQGQPQPLADGMDIGGTITLGSTLVIAGVLVLVVRRRRKLS